MRLPEGLSWWREVPGGGAWLERLPRLAAECAERWELRLGEPFEEAHVSLVVLAERAGGARAVLKLNFPEPESEHEAAALAHWSGDGAARLLADDPERRALLVERCEPGTTLWELGDEEEANRIAAGVLRRLWRPAPADHPFRLLADEATRWAEELSGDWHRLGRPFERELVDEAIAACLELGPGGGKPVVLHQDFHGGNVLLSADRGWLAIDPKPLVGDREFDAASLLRDRRWELRDPSAGRRIHRRLELLAEELGLDRKRMRGWGIAHALAWGMGEEKVEEDMVACARWLAAAR